MNFKYTSPEKIARRLSGKLQIIDPNDSNGASIDVKWEEAPDENNKLDINDYLNYSGVGTENIDQIGHQAVSQVLLKDIVEEEEENLELILDQIYQLPLKNNHKILENIVTSLVVGRLINIKFSVMNQDTEIEKWYFNYAYSLINMLIAGYDIETPFSKNQNKPNLKSNPRKLYLKGENLKIEEPEQKITNFHFSMTNFDNKQEYENFFLDNQ